MLVWQAGRVTETDPLPAPEWRRPSLRHRWWAVPLATVGCLLPIIPIVVSFIPARALVDKSRCAEYQTDKDGKVVFDDAGKAVCSTRVNEAVEYALVPASAEPVAPLLTITGADTYDSSGQIYFVTIVEPAISVLDWWVTKDDPAARLMSHRDKYGDRTPQQLVSAGQQQMRTAKDDAMYVALQAAGYPVELQPGDVIIDQLVCLEANAAGTECVKSAPADELLDPGDKLVKVDGKPVTIVDDLTPILAAVEPGEKIRIDFVRAGEDMSGEITTIAAPGEDPVRTIIGFMPVDTTTVKLPDGIDVQIATGGIGGPSAGLAFTLTVLDALTEGDLMGGHKVAVTGTIDLEGNVGAIGGLNSKASAVKQMGVEYFLVPVAQGEDGLDGIAQARKVVGDDVEIIPVSTLQEALDALRRIGGDPVVVHTTP